MTKGLSGFIARYDKAYVYWKLKSSQSKEYMTAAMSKIQGVIASSFFGISSGKMMWHELLNNQSCA